LKHVVDNTPTIEKICTRASVTRLNDLSVLQAKVASLPEARWRNKPNYILFALGGFSPELLQLAADPAERLSLVTETDMLSR
jgi:hypothetical protein